MYTADEWFDLANSILWGACAGVGVAIAIAQCGCKKQEFPVDLILDKSLPVEAIEPIARATDDWREATAGQALVWLSFGEDFSCDDMDTDHALYACLSTDLIVRERDAVLAPKQLLGFASTSRIGLVIDRLATPEEVHRVTLHELGHYFGLSHRDGTLMGPGHGACIDEGALEQWCEIYPCGGGEVGTCE